ncbi:chemotaxis protein CheA [Nocardiopsis sp. HNM0947]|uniref:Chemotaxis protein CheA n=1 Tax=Nocardiopsis coralli TaxID=2772213 RepID=A0ABR9P610_9ACTN|nr:chemotaxis protein CheA [Nocardiopsis coralli]MBE2999251.1 chemotaxis protein CheA [Nocardiopsis coralli]
MLTAGIAAAVMTAAAAPAAADTDEATGLPDTQDIVSDLENEGVYVDPAIDVGTGEGAIPEGEIAVLENAAAQADTPVYYVLVPEGNTTSEAGVNAFMEPVMAEVGDGVYGVLSGSDNFEVTSPNIEETQEIRELSLQEGGADTGNANPIDTLAAVPDAATELEEAQDANATSGFVLLTILVLLAAAGGWYVYNQRKKREAEKAKQLEEIKQMATEDVVRLGEDVSRLEIDLSKVDEPTREDYTRAMDSYDQAKSLLDTIQEPEQVRMVTGALEDGRYYMKATRARLRGEEVPERRGPCFFNPQHGPSTQDISWAPPGGSPREVTACDQCAEAVRVGGQPDVRMVEVDGERRPYYEAGPAYSPYANGYFGMTMMMGMFSGMMMGSMMGSMMGAGMMGGGAEDMGDAGGDFDGGGFDGGDFGDFGGFDF